MPLRIIRPRKMAAKDRPKTCAVARSLVFVVTRSLAFVMTSIPALRFLLYAGKRLNHGWAVAPAYVSSGQVSEGTQNYTSVQYRGRRVVLWLSGSVATLINSAECIFAIHQASRAFRWAAVVRTSRNRVIQVPRCGIGCQIAKSCADSDTHDDNPEAN